MTAHVSDLIINIARPRDCATVPKGNAAHNGVTMTDQPVEPGGPIDPNNPPPPPPTKPKGSSRDQANQENVGSNQSEGQATPASSPEAPNE